jgi:soluble lytic murein transglycosylase-like protein
MPETEPTTERRRREPRQVTGHVAAWPWWRMLLGGALLVPVAWAIVVNTTGVAAVFRPPAGPPDTLRHVRAPLPKPPVLVEARYLRRAVVRETGKEAEITALTERYNVTRTLARSIYDAAVAERIDPELAFRLIRVESVFDADAGNRGAYGLTQVMLGTARDIDPEVNTVRELLDPATNMRVGFTNLRNMLELFDGDVRLAVIAYNRGEVAVQRALRRGRDPENGYGERILGPRHHGGRRYSGPGLLPAPPDSTTTSDSAPR